MRLRHLTSFLEIARLGSVAAAAEALGVTQPAVSKTLKELENILGVELFDRVERRIRLNAAGQAFQKFAGAALTELARGQRAVLGNDPAEMRLSIGVLPTAAADLAPRAALKFSETHPYCRLAVLSGPNWLLRAQLREGRLDLVVGRMAPPKEMAGLTFEPLYVEDVVLVARSGHPLLRAAAQDLPDLLRETPLILPPNGALIRGTVEAYLCNIGLQMKRPLVETVSAAFGRRMAQLSDAVWFISRGVVAEDLATGALARIAVDHPMLSGPVGVSLRQGQEFSAEREALIAALRETAVGVEKERTL